MTRTQTHFAAMHDNLEQVACLVDSGKLESGL